MNSKLSVDSSLFIITDQSLSQQKTADGVHGLPMSLTAKDVVRARGENATGE